MDNNAHMDNNAQPAAPLATHQLGKVSVYWLFILSLVLLLVLIFIFLAKSMTKPEVETITREGVITQIQQLNRLHTIAYSVDTVITSKREGNWYALWQDQQKGLFVAHGRVEAGVDLSKLSEDMVQVSPATRQVGDKTIVTTHINITLPPSEVFSTYLDNIEVYDWQTGIFGLMKADSEILNKAQILGKQEVLERACQGDIMQIAANNAQLQVQQLFELTGATVTVTSQGVGACHL